MAVEHPGPEAGLSRRDLLKVAGGAVLATSATEGVAQGGATLTAVTYRSGTATIGAALARPETSEKAPGVIVIHENQGLVDYTRAVASDLARAGYVALAPNLISRKLGPDAPGGTDQARAALRELTTEEAIADLGAGIDYLKHQPVVRADRIGSVGFCYGGRLSLLLACHREDLRAAVIFYGRPADGLPLIPRIKAAVMGQFGEADGAIPVETVRQLEAALREQGKVHDIKIFPGAGHAFHRPRGPNYHPEAAREAWERTLNWLARHLKS